MNLEKHGDQILEWEVEFWRERIIKKQSNKRLEDLGLFVRAYILNNNKFWTEKQKTKAIRIKCEIERELMRRGYPQKLMKWNFK